MTDGHSQENTNYGGRRMQEKMDQWINWVEYDELLAGHHNAPHNLLGLHEFGK